MKKITLYNPKTGELRDYHGAPLALLAVSRFLVKEGYEVNIVEHYEKNTEDIVCDSVKDSICLGITAMTGYQIKDGLRIAQKVKKKFPKIPIVWGGWHPSILPDQTLKSPYVDIIVRGQGERTFKELIYALENKQDLSTIQGISYKIKKKIIHNPERTIEDINNFPELPFELVDVEHHLLNSEFGKRTLNYYASQGCPYNCGFCADPRVYRRRWTILEPKRIVAELKHLKKKYKIDSIIFTDSNFFINERHTIEFCELCIKEKLNLKFGQVDGRSNTLSRYKDSTWTLMKRAGFVNILNGMESGSQEILDFMNKGIKIEDTVKLVELGKRHNITIVGSTFIGLPTKNIDEEFRINIGLIDKLMKINPNNTYYLLTYTPYPGSPLYDLAIKCGFNPPTKLEEWAEFELHKITTPWVKKKYVNLGEQFDIYYFPFLGNQLKQIIKHYPPFFRFFANIFYYAIRLIVKLRWKLKIF
ncbi:MAG: radical SAM protein [Candidatus Woesearchaeota archaeon]